MLDREVKACVRTRHVWMQWMTMGVIIFNSVAFAAPVVPNVQLDIPQQAARFLVQSTFGPKQAEIDELAELLKIRPNTAYQDWLNREFDRPVTDEDLTLHTFRKEFPPDYPRSGYRQKVHEAGALRAAMMIDSSHQLRSRVAYSLGQIFVVSIKGDLIGSPEGLCDWQDLLFNHAFGRFEDLLMAVTTHPTMSNYLTSAGNAREGLLGPGSRPDENYAREVMQLFTIGLYHLQPDGEYVVKNGAPVPTYDNEDITELARVFTGMIYPKGEGERFFRDENMMSVVESNPHSNVRYGSMAFEERRHDDGRKSFLGGNFIRSGGSAEEDISDVIKILSKHPSTAPFISRALIQRLVTSNPSPAYVRAVADTFRKTDGNLKEVIKAILLNPEARSTVVSAHEGAGKLREPWLRFTHMARAFQVKKSDSAPFYPMFQKTLLPVLGQFPLASPSVFNFYLPSYEPSGEIADHNQRLPLTRQPFVGPEFQILHATTALSAPNYFLAALDNQDVFTRRRDTLALDLDPQIRLAANTKDLVQNIDTLLTSGMMSDSTRSIISTAIERLPDDSDEALAERAKLAIYLTLISPDYAVQK